MALKVLHVQDLKDSGFFLLKRLWEATFKKTFVEVIANGVVCFLELSICGSRVSFVLEIRYSLSF